MSGASNLSLQTKEYLYCCLSVAIQSVLIAWHNCSCLKPKMPKMEILCSLNHRWIVQIKNASDRLRLITLKNSAGTSSSSVFWLHIRACKQLIRNNLKMCKLNQFQFFNSHQEPSLVQDTRTSLSSTSAKRALTQYASSVFSMSITGMSWFRSKKWRAV